MTNLDDYKVGATVRQYHHDSMYDDAKILRAYPNGALDVEINGTRYGWSAFHCKVVDGGLV